MRGNRLPIRLKSTLAIFALILLATAKASSAQEVILHSFVGTDGGNPYANLVFDSEGNLYGTTAYGGAYGFGAVFELTPTTGGRWRETILHSFNDNGMDGYEPYGGLIFDGSGNLYGTTAAGGREVCHIGGIDGCGTVFELTPTTGGRWKETVLHNFNGTDGGYPQASLIFDAAGNLYGTAELGGSGTPSCSSVGCGDVFELTPASGGGWKEKVLHNFAANGTDGYYPSGGLIFDTAGNLYGTTTEGGAYGSSTGGGTVFELMPAAGGSWTETLLHSFNPKAGDGSVPVSPLLFDASGNLYGTTAAGGPLARGQHSAYGTVFELIPTTGGNWTETLLYSFQNNGTDGTYPYAGLIFDASGNLYGTTGYGGTGACTGDVGGCGTVFELTPNAGGGWSETVPYSFDGSHGYVPLAGLILDVSGNLYGTTAAGGRGPCNIGGPSGCGTVFEITP